jgi:hypothetical protein
VDVIEIVDDEDAPVNDSVSGTEPDLSNVQVAGLTLLPRIIHMTSTPDVDENNADVLDEEQLRYL